MRVKRGGVSWYWNNFFGKKGLLTKRIRLLGTGPQAPFFLY